MNSECITMPLLRATVVRFSYRIPYTYIPTKLHTVSPRKSRSPFPNERAHHQFSQPTSAVNPHNAKTTSPLLRSHLKHLSSHHLTQSALPSPTRSRTPDPLTSDNLTIPTDHVPVSRCTTAPAVQSFADVLAASHNDPAMRHGQRQSTHEHGFSAKEGWQAAFTCAYY
jgi:hypothetical protein